MNLRILVSSSLQILMLSIFLATSLFPASANVLLKEKKEEIVNENKEKKPGSWASDKIQFRSDNLVLDMGGKLVIENFFSNNMTTLNSKYAVDNVFFVRTTADYFLSMAYGDYEKPRIVFYDAFRFRFRWGTATEAKNADSFVTIGDVSSTVKGTATNKHVVWMREGWLKVKLGESDLNHYFQAGLVPYQVGRGISLGQAYEALGFLGFVPGSSIDQFAPGILLSANPIKNRLVIDAYLALTENNQLGIDSNIEVIRANEIDGCGQRGIGRQSFIAALRADILVYEQDKKKINIEPYFVAQHAPDQDLEFKNDVNTDVATAGLALEGVYKRFNWGMEGAANFGQIDIRPWDRNTIALAKDSSTPYTSAVIEQYTKVQAQDPLKVKKPTAAPVTTQITNLIKGSPKGVEYNGQQIGTAIVNGVDTPIYNAINRFRPEELRSLRGYFFVADASYDIIPKDLILSLGVGYASGEIDQQLDRNTIKDPKCLNADFNAFIPIQSVYSGKRLRHLVLFNQGIPRFAVKNPLADLSLSNVTSVVVSDTLNEMTNIAFVGARIDWKVPQLRKYKFNFSLNVIPYYIPDTAHFVVSHPEDAFILTQQSSNYLGTELTSEWSSMFYDKLKFSGYFGILIPGQHYKDLCGIPVGKGKLESGSDIAYVGNFQLTYMF